MLQILFMSIILLGLTNLSYKCGNIIKKLSGKTSAYDGQSNRKNIFYLANAFHMTIQHLFMQQQIELIKADLLSIIPI